MIFEDSTGMRWQLFTAFLWFLLTLCIILSILLWRSSVLSPTLPRVVPSKVQQSGEGAQSAHEG